ncbi:hypothetical protein N7449_003096 [Penicillium cf. viridicatum]|uniref:Uncharacterized protein n=1 Tax=Penicillium cf. viridicatum TaxID=2972119 RepID=A0A9W9MWL9_9EURO|nr:hypothetical protein N7449_003096 [Penicillium cf. viridicatum]
MSPTTGNSSADVSIWEQAYHDAWRHFQSSILDVLDRLAWHSLSPEYRQTTIEQLGRLPIEVDNIRSTGQAMFEHVPGCQTVREHHLTYFVDDFVRDRLKLDFRLNMLSWKLMNRPNSDRAVYNRLLRLLHSIKDRVPD